MASAPSTEAAPTSAYWRHTRRLTMQLLLVWFSVTFCMIFFARELATFTLFGWPLSFYLAAQGVLLLYTLIVAIYAYKMRRLDNRFTSRKDHVK